MHELRQRIGVPERAADPAQVSGDASLSARVMIRLEGALMPRSLNVAKALSVNVSKSCPADDRNLET
jgi:hypothetical protein